MEALRLLQQTIQLPHLAESGPCPPFCGDDGLDLFPKRYQPLRVRREIVECVSGHLLHGESEDEDANASVTYIRCSMKRSEVHQESPRRDFFICVVARDGFFEDRLQHVILRL